MANRHEATVGGKTFWVDSNLEERVLRELEANGFSGRWERPSKGTHAGGKNYTPDVYLMIEYGGMSHRAILEIKPVLDGPRGFSDYISQRMRKAARVYYVDILLLYVDATRTYYQIDFKTGALTDFGFPVPAKIPIDKAYKPLTVPAKSVWSHRYEQRLDSFAAKAILNVIADILEGTVNVLFGPAKPKRRLRRRSHKRK